MNPDAKFGCWACRTRSLRRHKRSAKKGETHVSIIRSAIPLPRNLNPQKGVRVVECQGCQTYTDILFIIAVNITSTVVAGNTATRKEEGRQITEHSQRTRFRIWSSMVLVYCCYPRWCWCSHMLHCVVPTSHAVLAECTCVCGGESTYTACRKTSSHKSSLPPLPRFAIVPQNA